MALQPGLTLVEMLVVVGIMAALVGVGLPAVRALLRSFDSEDSVRTMIQTVLSSARAMALEQQRYIGVRFQEDPNGHTYMVLITEGVDSPVSATKFKAVGGIRPVRLPDAYGIMDLTVVRKRSLTSNDFEEVRLAESGTLDDAQKDALLNQSKERTDMATFSVVFSPVGRVVTHVVRVSNKEGQLDTKAHGSEDVQDDIFNKKGTVDRGLSLLYQDDYFGQLNNSYGDLGLGPEPSRQGFVIYTRRMLNVALQNRKAWSDYLKGLARDSQVYVSPMGTLVVTEKK